MIGKCVFLTQGMQITIPAQSYYRLYYIRDYTACIKLRIPPPNAVQRISYALDNPSPNNSSAYNRQDDMLLCYFHVMNAMLDNHLEYDSVRDVASFIGTFSILLDRLKDSGIQYRSLVALQNDVSSLWSLILFASMRIDHLLLA